MKIFISFLQGKSNHPIPAYSFWEYYIKNGITESGDSWIENSEIDWAEGLVYQDKSKELENWKEITWQKTLEYIKINRPDIFLSYLYPKQIDINAINEIKKLGIPCVNFFCDHIREYKSLPKEFHVFDLNWVPEHEALDLYKKNDLAYIHLPMPMWVAPNLRTVNQHHNSEITFIGSCDVQRILFFNKYFEIENAEANIYGKGWLNDDVYQNSFVTKSHLTGKLANQINFIKRHGLIAYSRKVAQRKLLIQKSDKLKNNIHGIINFETYIDLTKSSFVTIGINRFPSFNYPLNKPHNYSRLRDIEAPMLGACYVTEQSIDIDYFYEKDEILKFSSPNELIDKISYLKKKPTNRLEIMEKTQQTALETLSIPISLSKIKSRL